MSAMAKLGRLAVAALTVWLFSATAGADTLLLVQGYLAGDNAWRSHGVTVPLERAGWADGGPLIVGPLTVRAGATIPADNRFYTVVLPTEAPIELQSQVLARYVDFVKERHGDEPLYLVGHSAGGVVARYYMVTHPKKAISGLVTIASPNLGADTAELAAIIGETPLSELAPLFGAQTFNRSQSLYHELIRERPGTFLFWLNRQPHPDAHYAALIRPRGSLFGVGDIIVPSWSQDLNRVAALNGRAQTIPTVGDHSLSVGDGAVLAELLYRFKHPK